MAMASESSTIGEHLKWRKPRNPPISTRPSDPIPNPNIPSIIQSTRCKSTISSLLISTFTNNTNPETSHHKTHKKPGFKTSSLRGFGCTAQPEVSVPAIIRSSAQWEDERESSKKNKKKKKKKVKKKGKQIQGGLNLMRDDSIGVRDLWCGPGIGSDAADSVDCVVSATARPLSGRGKIDVDELHHRERISYSSRQRVNAEQFASLEPDPSFETPHFGLDLFDDRYYHHLRHRSPEGLAEIMMFQNGFLMGRRSGGLDRYRDWRLDVDNMTYEELLELGDRIGHVNTGLGEDQIGRCLRKTKLSVLDEVSSELHNPSDEVEGKCSICQEEYEAEDEVGRLECGHAYHLHCIKQWLAQKNACPVCKAEASSK